MREICCGCDKPIPKPKNEFTTGYGVDSQGRKFCYECCAEQDREWMREHDKITLYLVENKDIHPLQMEVTNWPGTLRLLVRGRSSSRHNWAGKRQDVWFRFEGNMWWGRQYGYHSQLCHCKRIKG